MASVIVRLYVSLAKIAICVVSEHGKIVKEAQVASEPEVLVSWIGEQNGSIAASNEQCATQDPLRHLIDQSQKMTVAAMQMADMKVCAHRS